MAEDRIEIGIYGTQEAIAALKLRHGAVARGARIAMSGATLRILGRVKKSFGEAGKPQRRTGHLSRSIIRLVVEESGVITGIVGSTMPYKKGYAAILEKGGQLPAMTITAKKGKFLRFFTGQAGVTYTIRLGTGATVKQAVAHTLKVHRLGGYRKVKGVRAYRKGKGSTQGNVIFARSVKIPARYQRAMPYLRPAFDDERPLIPDAFRAAIRKELGLEGASAGQGEG